MRFSRIVLRVAAVFAAAALPSGHVLAQGTIQQSGPVVPYHAPYWVQNGIQGDSGSAAGLSPSGTPAAGVSEQLLSVRGQGTPPYAGAGTGPLGTNWCDYDAPVNNPGGYHYLCLSPNAAGGGLIDYGAIGAAAQLPLSIDINGAIYQFPFVLQGVAGPGTSVVGDFACWNNTTGTLLSDCGPGPNPNTLREITSGSTDTATTADITIAWNSSAASAKTETLYACNSGHKGYQLYIKDEYGNAGTYSIAMAPNGSDTIDKNMGTSNIVADNLRGVQIQCNGSGNWIVK